MPKRCTICEDPTHTQFYCPKKRNTPLKRSVTPIKRTPIKKIGKHARAWSLFRKEYLKLNPPDEFGYYTCYLQTTPLCPIRLSPEQATIEHIIPKGGLRGRSLKFNEENLAIACIFCNGDKGSQPLEAYLEKRNKV